MLTAFIILCVCTPSVCAREKVHFTLFGGQLRLCTPAKMVNDKGSSVIKKHKFEFITINNH